MGFHPVKLASARKIVAADVAISIRKSAPNRLVIRINGAALKKLSVPPRSIASPYLDPDKGQVMLLFGDSKALPSAQKSVIKGKALNVEFPRVDEFAGDPFPTAPGLYPARLIEVSSGRIVFAV